MRSEEELDNIARVLTLARQQGFVRARDLDQIRVERVYLSRLVEKDLLMKVGRGIYMMPEAPISEWHTLAVTARLIPDATICLLSALRFHSLGTQNPHEVWIAVNRRAATSHLDYPKVRIIRPSNAALTAGVDIHQIEGVAVRIYSAAKTVVDCFRYRNKIGMDVALEALREGLRARKFTRDDLLGFAKQCHVTTVIRPYLEALS